MAGWLGSRLKQVRMSSHHLGMLMRQSPRLGRLVIQQIPIWDQCFGTEFRLWLVELCVTFRHRDACVHYFIESLPGHFSGLWHFYRQRFSKLFVRLSALNHTLEGSDEWVIELWKTLPNLIVRFDDEWIVEWVQQNGLDETDQTLASALNRLRVDTESTDGVEGSHRPHLFNGFAIEIVVIWRVIWELGKVLSRFNLPIRHLLMVSIYFSRLSLRDKRHWVGRRIEDCSIVGII